MYGTFAFVLNSAAWGHDMSSSESKPPSGLSHQLRATAQRLAALSTEAAADPALRARVDAALRALEGAAPPERNTAILENPADARSMVRDVVAEELARYWNRRFGGTP